MTDEERELLHRKTVLMNAVDSHPPLIELIDVLVRDNGLVIFNPGPMQWCESLV